MFECCQNVNRSNHPIFTSECVLGPVSEVKNMPYLKGKVKEYFGVDQIDHAVSIKGSHAGAACYPSSARRFGMWV